VGHEVNLSAVSLAAEASYGVHTVPCGTTIDAGATIGEATLETDVTGAGSVLAYTCTSPGCFRTYVDLASDGLWQSPAAACDTSLVFSCETCAVTDPSSDLYHEATGLPFPDATEGLDIVGLESVATTELAINVAMNPLGIESAELQLVLDVDDPDYVFGAGGVRSGGGLSVSVTLSSGELAVAEVEYADGGGVSTDAASASQVEMFWDDIGGTLSVSAPNPFPLAATGDDLLITGVRLATSVASNGATDSLPDQADGPVYTGFVDLAGCSLP